MNSCFTSVSDGKAAVAAALTGQGTATAGDATFATLAVNVTTSGNTRYNAGVAAADGRVNTASASYSAGVAAADARANPSSMNYQSGYNAGKAAAALQKIHIGDNNSLSSRQFSCGGIAGYNTLTTANFVIQATSIGYTRGAEGGANENSLVLENSISYNPSNAILTVPASFSYGMGKYDGVAYYYYVNYRVYVIKNG